MQAWLTQAVVRAPFGEGAAKSGRTVFHDQGEIGMPHPCRHGVLSVLNKNQDTKGTDGKPLAWSGTRG